MPVITTLMETSSRSKGGARNDALKIRGSISDALTDRRVSDATSERRATTTARLAVILVMPTNGAWLRATANYGEIWGWKDVGRIAPGAFADILVLDHNPAEDVAALRDIHTLIVGGRVMDGAQLLKK
jgi:imidazolonepropionase-like amidohydrolase